MSETPKPSKRIRLPKLKPLSMLLMLGLLPLKTFATPYEDLINKHSLANGVDPKLTTAVITRESAFNSKARSNKDARGLMQVIPSTARLVGVDPSRLYDPEQNIIAGTRYLAYLNKMFNGDVTKVIAGYNAGHGAVLKYNGIPPYRETQNYVRFVSNKYLALNGYSTSTIQPVATQEQYQVYKTSYKPTSAKHDVRQNLTVAQQQIYNSFNNSTTIYVKNF